MEDVSMPWYQLGDETDEAYALFKAYLELGDARSYKHIATLNFKSLRTVKRIGRKWDWNKRVKAWEQYMKYHSAIPFLEKVKNLEHEKFLSRLNIAADLLRALPSITMYLDNTTLLHKNQFVVQHLKYYRDVIKTYKLLMSVIDFSLPSYVHQKEAFITSHMNEILGKTENKELPFSQDDIKNFHLFADSLMKSLARGLEEECQPAKEDNPQPQVVENNDNENRRVYSARIKYLDF